MAILSELLLWKIDPDESEQSIALLCPVLTGNVAQQDE